MRPLGREEIRAGVRQAIGGEPLRKLAEGRKDAVIIVDDLSRPTPAFAVIPFILDELKAGGIRDENTKIITSLGLHRPITVAEQRRKLGRDIVDRVEVLNHNAFTRRLKRYPRPGGGPPFGINRIVADADLKIAVSGIIRHGGAGFGGGAKAILPGVASYDTIRYNHETYAWEEYGKIYPHEIQSPCIRRDMELCARAVGLDFSINLVFTPYKEVLGVFSGDVVAAHREGCLFARPLYLTRTPAEQLDVVLACSYPMDTDVGQSLRGTWPEEHGRRSVLVTSARDAWVYHGDNGKSYRVYRRTRASREASESPGCGEPESVKAMEKLFYSPTLNPGAYYERKVERRLMNSWDDVIADLGGNGRSLTVGVFPYSSLSIAKETRS
jgi:nickel-dependent lactate racemase